MTPSGGYQGLSVAIVGLGPAGAYAAGLLLSNSGIDVHVDVFEKLPTPWGLVRAGVAPDHPNIKRVTRVYEATAEHPRFRYFGNVELGRHVTREDLLARYQAVIYAVGTPGDRPLSIPGEELPGSVAATSFVGWYNGHPDHRDDLFDLDCRRAIVVGNGNVAIDVARMLMLNPEELARTDMADHALAALARSRIEEVVVVGRRGPEQAAFTNPELRDLGRMSDADVSVNPSEVAVPSQFRERNPTKTAERNLALLQQYARSSGLPHGKRIALRFLLSPTRILGDGRVQAVELVRNRLVRSPDGSLRAQPTGAHATLATGLVLRAVGYRGRPIAGVPFDERRGTIANTDGRVIDADGRQTREYVVGWAKRGPSGVIGTNKRCALDTVRVLFQDLVAGRLATPVRGGADIETFLRSRQPRLVGYADWQTLDHLEQELGRCAGRPRVKLTTVAEMVDVVDARRRVGAGPPGRVAPARPEADAGDALPATA
jgi:ferredoxin--NADP+ reductase